MSHSKQVVLHMGGGWFVGWGSAPVSDIGLAMVFGSDAEADEYARTSGWAQAGACRLLMPAEKVLPTQFDIGR